MSKRGKQRHPERCGLRFLSSHGERAEALQQQEQRFGYWTRMPDGREIRIIRDPDDW